MLVIRHSLILRRLLQVQGVLLLVLLLQQHHLLSLGVEAGGGVSLEALRGDLRLPVHHHVARPLQLLAPLLLSYRLILLLLLCDVDNGLLLLLVRGGVLCVGLVEEGLLGSVQLVALVVRLRDRHLQRLVLLPTVPDLEVQKPPVIV